MRIVFLQLLYTRLLMCHQIGAKYAAEKHASLLNNPVAVDLGLDDPNGPATVLAQTTEHLGRPLEDDTNVVYLYLLSACDKLFDNEMDQATFEEHMRWFFGTKVNLSPVLCSDYDPLKVTPCYFRHTPCSPWTS